jgi:lysophospholipase L1-like esterase
MAALLLIPVVFSVLADRTLGFFGFPGELPTQVSHPRGFREIRRNVEFTYEFATNDQGLRYRNIRLAKPKETYRVLVVGDSMTEGVGVAQDETFSDLLERRFSRKRPVEFINGGLGGTGVFEYGRLFLSWGVAYEVDALLVAVFANDVWNAAPDDHPEDLLLRREGDEFFGPIPERSFPKRLIHAVWPRIYTRLYQLKAASDRRNLTMTSDLVGTISAEARRRGIPEGEIDAWQARLPPNLVVAVNQQRMEADILSYGLLMPSHWTDSLDIDTPAAKARFRSMRAMLDRIVEEAARRGIDVAVVYLPDRLQYDADSHVGNPTQIAGVRFRKEWLAEDSTVQRELALWSRERGIAFLDLTSVFRAWAGDPTTLTYRIDGHWTPKGHRVAADAIGAWLQDGGIFHWIPRTRRQDPAIR